MMVEITLETRERLRQERKNRQEEKRKQREDKQKKKNEQKINDMIVVYAPQKGEYYQPEYKMVFVGIVKDNVFQVGYSRCNSKDKWNKKIGIKIARETAEINPSMVLLVNFSIKQWKNYFKDFLYVYAAKTYMNFYEIKKGNKEAF